MAASCSGGQIRRKLLTAPEVKQLLLDAEDDSDSSVSDYCMSDNDPEFVPKPRKNQTLSDSTTSISSGEEENHSQPEQERGRKRTRRPVRSPNEWRQNKRKRLRNAGERYETKTGKIVDAKTMNPLENHKCRLNCTDKVTHDQRQALFDSFWELGDFNVQNSYLSGCISLRKTQRHRGRKNQNISRRSTTRTYTLHIQSQSIQVCKTFFLATFGISNGRCSRIFEKIPISGGVVGTDKRGKHGKHKHTDPEKLQEIRDHTLSFPAYQSHYTRARHTDTRTYLSPDLCIAKMFDLYCQKQNEEGKTHLKESFYRHIFNHEFNISFHTPRKDTCKKCDALNIEIQAATGQEKEKLKHDLELHHRVAELSRESLKRDTAAAKVDTGTGSTKEVITFDLEKTLPTPHIPTGVAYYKRQLWTYNLGIHSLTSGQAEMYLWHEGQAKRGPSEVGSCLYKYIIKIGEQGVESITAYSDCCGGQNRNYKIAMFWSHIVSTTPIKEVNHKFMESGHSYLPNDQDFGHIENKKRRAEVVYTPDGWAKLISDCKKRNPFKVYQMKKDDFKNPEYMTKWMVNRKKDTAGNKVSWLKIKWLKFVKNSPFTMFFKQTLNEDMPFVSVDMARYQSSKRKETVEINVKALPVLYQKPVPINPLKLKDLRELLHYVPPVHHPFFLELESDDNASANVTHPDDDGFDDDAFIDE